MFRPFVPLNFIFQMFRFRKIYDLVILRSTYEEHIWFLTITFSTLIFKVDWIEGRTEFIMDLLFLCWFKKIQLGVILHNDSILIEQILLFL